MDSIIYPFVAFWCSLTGCYQCIDYTMPNLQLPEFFYIDKELVGRPITKKSVKWKGPDVITYRYKVERDGITYEIIGPAERSGGATGAYWLSAKTINGNPVTVRAEVNWGDIKSGYENSDEEKMRQRLNELGASTKTYEESFEIWIAGSKSREYVRYQVSPVGVGHESDSYFELYARSVEIYQKAYCYSEFR